MEEKKKLDKSDIAGLILVGAIIITTIICSILAGIKWSSKDEKPKPKPEVIEATAATYNNKDGTLAITTPKGNKAYFNGYSVTFEATAETTTITLNKGKTNEIIITLTEGEE